MTIRRDARTPVIRGGKQYGTSQSIEAIQQAVSKGEIQVREEIAQGMQRLDILAGQEYNDSRMWWIIAAASGIGWGLQVPPGTRILVPTDLGQIASVVG